MTEEYQVTTKGKAEEDQVQQEMKNQQREMKKQVATKDPKKVEVGKKLAEYNRRKRKGQKSEMNQYYGTGAVLAVGVIGGLDYYLYKPRKEKYLLSNLHILSQIILPSKHTLRLISLKWINFFCTIKWTRRV